MTPPFVRTIDLTIRADKRLLSANLTIAILRLQLGQQDRDNRLLRLKANEDRYMIDAIRSYGREQERELIRLENTVTELRATLSRKDSAFRQTTSELSEEIRANDQLRKRVRDLEDSLATVATHTTGSIVIDLPTRVPLG